MQVLVLISTSNFVFASHNPPLRFSRVSGGNGVFQPAVPRAKLPRFTVFNAPAAA
jgi:hypothetical protein